MIALAGLVVLAVMVTLALCEAAGLADKRLDRERE